ncbi:MAG: exonuclease [Desulfatirhabdiaceae bacterium]
MSFLSSNVSITNYIVNGQLEEPVAETIFERLSSHVIEDIDGEATEKSVGWTSYDNPFEPDFKGSQFIIGSHFVFSLRIDKKQISPRVILKHYQKELAKKLKETGRDYLNKGEKKAVKDYVITMLYQRIPASPYVYDMVWNYEKSRISFFSNQKTANDEFETLFIKSFNLELIRIFPYTSAFFLQDISDSEKDILNSLKPDSFI